MFVHPSESVATVLSVLRVFYQCCECFIKKQTEISMTSIYETIFLCTLFSLNQHTSMFATGIHLLAYKHHVYGVLAGSYTEAISPVAISPCNKAVYHLWTKQIQLYRTSHTGQCNIACCYITTMYHWAIRCVDCLVIYCHW